MQEKRILIVEDEEDMLDSIALKAYFLKYSCVKESTGEWCLVKAKNYIPSVILLDLNLPKISGLDLLTELKRCAETKHIPIIVFSAMHDPRVIDEAMLRGASTYFTKGGDIDDLFDLIKAYTEDENTEDKTGAEESYAGRYLI
ncbi:MAG: response regulator [Deltaproteobacteria bacterium]|nr:response regulator [Deltaproteobacteria bacterium]